MGLETGTYISDLNSANPTATDVKSEGDDHLRLIKSTVKATFPNVSGAATPTHTELNFLASQEGAFLLKGIAAAGGSVNAITADFTPNVSLTNNVTVIVEAAGANTSATVTFSPDGLTAKNVKKNGNQALEIGDIYGAGHRLILSYDSSNDVWELLNPSTNAISSVSGYTGGRNIYLNNEVSDSTAFTLTSLSASAWHDIGPTGSGATNTWTALNSVPSNAKFIRVKVVNSIDGATTATLYGSYVFVRKNGSSASATNQTQISSAALRNRSGSSEYDSNHVYFDIPVSTSIIFDAQRQDDGGGTPVVTFYLIGWVS